MALPALASSTGVGLCRLTSSVSHNEVISLTFQIKKSYGNFYKKTN